MGPSGVWLAGCVPGSGGGGEGCCTRSRSNLSKPLSKSNLTSSVFAVAKDVGAGPTNAVLGFYTPFRAHARPTNAGILLAPSTLFRVEGGFQPPFRV